MKKNILSFLCMIMFTLTTHAQEKSLSVVVGVNPGVGSLNTNIKLDDEEYDLDYKMNIAFSADIEKQFKGAVTLSEFRYAKWKLDDVDLYKGANPIFPMTSYPEDVSSFSFMQYLGKTIFPNMRFQLPIYLGVGADYLLGEPYHNLFFDVGLKARAKFYIIDNIGIFVDADAKLGWGQSQRGLSDVDTYFTIYKFNYGVNFGLTVNI